MTLTKEGGSREGFRGVSTAERSSEAERVSEAGVGPQKQL